MSTSHERVHYGIRPAKAIERKMIAEVLQRLSHFGALDRYAYVGMGSLYFADFILFHKVLGTRSMVSLEEDGSNETRFRFNVPYSFVRLKIGKSDDLLPAVLKHRQTILWLDYDRGFGTGIDVLKDCKTFAETVSSGSILVVTLADQEYRGNPPHALSPARRFSEFQELVGRQMIPATWNAERVANEGMTDLYREVVSNHISKVLEDRNGVESSRRNWEFKQLLNFRYKDSASMATFGGILYRNQDAPKFDACRFGNLEFVRCENQPPFEIKAPKLTFREIRHLDSHLPGKTGPFRHCGTIPRGFTDQYRQVYRYFPAFVEAEVS